MVRELIKQLPFIAQCYDADRFSDRNLMIFDKEIAEPGSVFAFREGDAERDRLAVLEIPTEFIINQDEYKYGMDRLRIAMLSQDKAEGRITEDQERELSRLSGVLMTASKVDDILPMDKAVRGSWH